MKLLVGALVVVNALLFAWWQGFLSPLWDPPGTSEREPARAARQLRPETITVVGGPRHSGARQAPAAGATQASP